MIYICQPETVCHYSDSHLFTISLTITSELLALHFLLHTASAPMSLSQALEKRAHYKNEPTTFTYENLAKELLSKTSDDLLYHI